jgi:hypothetical protein
MRTLLTILALAWATVAQAANPAFTDMNTNEFLTTGNKVFFKRMTNNVGVMSIAFDAASVPDTSGITNCLDVVGVGDFALHQLVTDGSQNIYGIGPSALAQTTLAPFSGQIFAYGDSALSGATITNATGLYLFGTSAGFGMTGDGMSALYGIGNNAFASTFFTNGSSQIYVVGNDAFVGASVDSGVELFTFGDHALNAAAITNSSQIYGFGNDIFDTATFNNANNIYGFGKSILSSAVVDGASSIIAVGPDTLAEAEITANSTEIFMLGSEAGSGIVLSSSASIYGIGNSALADAVFTNSLDVVAIGNDAGSGMQGTFSHVFLVGSSAMATGNNQWVAGDDAYDYHFPGTAGAGFASVITATNGVASMALDAAVSIAATGWTNTFAKNAVVYFSGTTVTATVFNGAGTSVFTNAVPQTGMGTVLLQPAGKVILSGTGVTGQATPF